MSTNPLDRESNLLQYLGYLLFPAVVFLFGFLLAKFLFPLVNLNESKWSAPAVVGAIFTVFYAWSTIIPLHGNQPFGPALPNNKTLALTKSVSAALYSLIAAEFVLMRTQPNDFTEWDTTVYAVAIPILIIVTSIRFYRAYQEPSTN